MHNLKENEGKFKVVMNNNAKRYVGSNGKAKIIYEKTNK